MLTATATHWLRRLQMRTSLSCSFVGSRGSPEWICTVDMGTVFPGTPMSHTHGNDKVFHGWGSEKWQSLHLIQIWVLMDVWPLSKTRVQQASTVASFSGIFPTWNWFSMWTSYWHLLSPPFCAVRGKQTKVPCCTGSALHQSKHSPPVLAVLYVCLPFLHCPRIAWAQVFRTDRCGARHSVAASASGWIGRVNREAREM